MHECEYVKTSHAALEQDRTIRTENVPGDDGGLTFAGIDKASHPFFPYSNPAPSDVIIEYQHDWYSVQAHKLAVPIGETVANFAVNRGPRTAIKMLQQAVNHDPYESIDVDGELGPITLDAVTTVKNALTFSLLIVDIADTQYRALAARAFRYRQFLQGWLNRDKDLITFDQEDFKTYA